MDSIEQQVMQEPQLQYYQQQYAQYPEPEKKSSVGWYIVGGIVIIVIIVLVVLFFMYKDDGQIKFSGYYEQNGERFNSELMVIKKIENQQTVYEGVGSDVGPYKIVGFYITLDNKPVNADLPANGAFFFSKQYKDYEIIYKGLIQNSQFTGEWWTSGLPHQKAQFTITKI